MSGVLTALFFVSFSSTIVLIPLMIRIARKVNFLDLPGPRKIHTEPVPYGGGLAVAATVLLATGYAIYYHRPIGGLILPPPRLPWKSFSWPVYSMGSMVILVLGLVDDRKKLSAGFKLLVQTIVATGVAVGGERLRLFDVPAPLSVAVTVLWILAVTNAFNLLDHMDGLSSGVALIAGSAFLVVALQTDQQVIARMIVPLLGACAGFLLFNFPPAKIFLGDAGSLFIGFWLSCLTISFTFYDAHYPLYTYFVPLAVLAVPLFDTSSVVLIRLLRRKPLFEGDTNHLAHRLTALGMSRRGAVLTVYALTLNAGLAAVLLYHVVSQSGALLILVQLLLTFGIITLLEAAGRKQDG
ncbi:MAG: undecaprenyl/decaprenyl-phosphate alpha-N-acetylglucosaminyl 1-phosphate transferase [Planctomycetes bacterium]|nr:undecaprenyl/decaprenyl-phosphate alpha-N-acetylglucosaminyl 1-phosphate transferase [Planctomycetota bacterium]